MTVEIPDSLVTAQLRYNGDLGRAFLAALPERAATFLRRWRLTRDGPVAAGVCALVLPVRRSDGTPAVLKLQYLDDETVGEPVALRAWDGRGAARLLAHDPGTGTMLLERLDASRQLGTVADSRAAVLVIAGLLARLTAVRAPSGLRDLGTMVRATVPRTPAVRTVEDPGARRVLEGCTAALRELVADADAETDTDTGAGARARADGSVAGNADVDGHAEADGHTEADRHTEADVGGDVEADAGAGAGGGFGNRLLHWDLHFENVLAGGREPWLAIDPKPLSGDPGFELFPALHNRFAASEVVWRFDAMTDVLGLDRERARAWTLVRVLQFCLWDAEQHRLPGAVQVEVGRRLLDR
ncbi:aminoglycoside phosphotransferase family protein [Streptomyces sp. TS71-3]|uniref:aminoglycoside phosphotransferase family protein n=1 Tax=Streptomyces sp. TS71-3 TaxID=2733862 RepID=UPI001B091BEA|nr:aminoglycoside phosphotransferase family protein [Streptomyces sp. TS71-3]GHJ34506.1 hypothetical protein Sm713_01150 [Streptomyces sp. TS71-3]